MRNSRHGNRAAAAILAAAVAVLSAGAVRAEPPERVVSINLCTDLIAMMVAGEGQLLSVSWLASDPVDSPMADAARGYLPNRGLAEEIYLMQPGLVLADRYSNGATLSMLDRLGIPVAIFDQASSLDAIRSEILQMGAVLEQEDRAAAIVHDFDTRLAALQTEVAQRPRAALYHANGYTSGERTLAGQILLAAGFDNIATGAGFPDGGFMPLEVLAMAAPDVVITSAPYPGASRAEEILDHPALRAFRDDLSGGALTDSDWVCGTPLVLNAIEDMAALRRSLTGGAG